MTTAVYLASASPRRKELLSQLGVEFTQFSVDADESPLPNEQPRALVERLARLNDFTHTLKRLSGNTHQVLTAVAFATQSDVLSCVVSTDVTFKTLTDEEINAYWESGEPQDKAGGYGIQGLGGRFVTHIAGSYFSVVGLPLYETEQLLKTFLRR
mgnify:CR=1 FL=1